MQTKRHAPASKAALRRAWATFLAGMIALVGAAVGPAAAHAASGDPVSVPDVGLKGCINASLGHAADSAITEAQLAGLTALTCDNRGISSLTGLEFATGLTTFSANRNNISDATPLRGLPKLRGLFLVINQLSDISSLAGFPALENLNLSLNQIADTTPLGSLTTLKTLSIEDNQVTSIAPLASLGGLQELRLNDNKISDLGPLAGLTGLKTLLASLNPISDLGPLSSLTELSFLGLVGDQVENIAPLSSLTKLAHLDFYGNTVNDLGPIQNLPALASLNFDMNKVTDLTPLAPLKDTLSSLSGRHQFAGQLPDVAVGVAFPNPLVDADGSPVAPSSGAVCANENCSAIKMATPGNGLTIAWQTNIATAGTDPGPYSATAIVNVTNQGPSALDLSVSTADTTAAQGTQQRTTPKLGGDDAQGASISRVQLLDGTGAAVDTVSVPGEGEYRVVGLDIVFTPEANFTGHSSGVSFQVIADTPGGISKTQTVTGGKYQPVVTKKPPVHGEPALKVLTPKVSSADFVNQKKGVGVRMTGCAPDEEVVFTITPSSNQHVRRFERTQKANADGTAVVKLFGFGVDGKRYSGDYDVVASCGGTSLKAAFTVTGRSADSGDPQKPADLGGAPKQHDGREKLASTGAVDTTLAAWGGFLVLVAGGALVSARALARRLA